MGKKSLLPPFCWGGGRKLWVGPPFALLSPSPHSILKSFLQACSKETTKNKEKLKKNIFIPVELVGLCLFDRGLSFSFVSVLSVCDRFRVENTLFSITSAMLSKFINLMFLVVLSLMVLAKNIRKEHSQIKNQVKVYSINKNKPLQS